LIPICPRSTVNHDARTSKDSKTAEFDYELPPELIAQHTDGSPGWGPYDGACIVANNGSNTAISLDLPDYLRTGDLVVVNNTKVIPARLFARKPGTGGRAEIFLLEQ
jgi:S-adenosylmethionine:tRNA ribosyltransferase-isomerase